MVLFKTTAVFEKSMGFLNAFQNAHFWNFVSLLKEGFCHGQNGHFTNRQLMPKYMRWWSKQPKQLELGRSLGAVRIFVKVVGKKVGNQIIERSYYSDCGNI